MVDSVSPSKEQIPCFYRAVNSSADLLIKDIPSSLGSSFCKTLCCSPRQIFTSMALDIFGKGISPGYAYGRSFIGTYTYHLIDPVTDKLMKAILFPCFSKHSNKSAKTLGEGVCKVAKFALTYAATNFVWNYYKLPCEKNILHTMDWNKPGPDWAFIDLVVATLGISVNLTFLYESINKAEGQPSKAS